MSHTLWRWKTPDREPSRRSAWLFSSRVLFACIVCAGTLVTEARAQETPDTLKREALGQDTVFTLQGVTVNITRPVATSGGSSAVDIPLDSINVAPAPTLEQVLRTVPLIQIRDNSRGEAQPSLRGSEDRQIAVLVDGIPLTLGWDHRTDLSVIPLTAIEDIRLIRGLSSVLYGPNVLGGVVSVNVARGSDRRDAPEPLMLTGGVDQTGATQLGGSGGVLLEGGSGQWVIRGGLGHRRRDGDPLSDRLKLESPDQEELLSADGSLRLNSDMEHLDGFVSARYQGDGGGWLSVGASGYAAERGVPPEVNEDEPRLWRYPEQWRALAAVTGGTGHRNTAWGVGDIEASFGLDLQHNVIDEYATPAYSQIVGGETGDTRTLTARLLGEHTVGARGQFRASATYGDVTHDEELRPDDLAAKYRQRLWSLGAEGDWGLGSTGTTRISAGAVVDGSDTPESGDKPPLGTLWDWGARVGASSLVGDGNVLLHGSVSRRTRFPSLRELYSGALGRFLPNPDLRPESLVGAELGVTVTGRVGEVQIVGFHHRVEDGIVRVSVQTDEGPKRQRVNQTRIRSTGLELLASGALGGLEYSGDLTLQKVRLLEEDGSEAKAEYQPDWAGKLSLGGALPWELHWTAGARFIGQQFCTTTTETGSDTLDASGALDLGLRRVFSLRGGGTLTSLDLLAAVDNVTDAAYFDQCGLPRPGRRLRLQFRLF